MNKNNEIQEAIRFASETLDKIIKYNKDMKKRERIVEIEKKIAELKCEVESLKDYSVDLNACCVDEVIWRCYDNNPPTSYWLHPDYEWTIDRNCNGNQTLTPTHKE